MNRAGVANLVCKKCKLYSTCATPFMRTIRCAKEKGKPRILVVGEAPNTAEDKEGRPFIGRTGSYIRNKLNNILGSLEGVFLTNAVRCKPEGGKLTSVKPLKYCREFVFQDIERIKPSFILLLGSKALLSVMDLERITLNRGKVLEYITSNSVAIPVTVALHPASTFYDPKNKKKFLQDLEFFKQVLNGNKKTSEDLLLSDAVLDASVRDIRAFHKRARALKKVTIVDVETNSLYPYSLDQAFSVLSISMTCSGKTIVIQGDQINKTKECMMDADIIKVEALKDFLEDARCPKAGHNFKYDMHAIYKWISVTPKKWVVDTLALDQILRPSDVLHDLKTLASHHAKVGEYDKPLKRAQAAAKKEAASYLATQNPEMNAWAWINPKLIARYNAIDTATNEKVYYAQLDALQEEDKRHQELSEEPGGAHGMVPSLYFKRVAMPALRFLQRMEQKGMLVDVEYAKKLEKDTEARMIKLEEALRRHPFARQLQMHRFEELCLSDKSPKTQQGKDSAKKRLVFNPGSDQQIGTLLFSPDYFGLIPDVREVSEKTERPSVSKEIIERHAKENEGTDVALFIQNVLELRQIKKTLGTYIKGIITRLSTDQRIRSTYGWIRTGRLSSKDPNLQNIKDDKALRKMFVVPENHILIDADFSQIELRVLAALCGDQDMCKIYCSGEDLHMETARAIFEKKDISKSERRVAKAVNFGIVYKESAWGLAKNLTKEGLPTTVQEAEEMITALFNRFPGILQWQEETIEFAREHGRVYTMFGRWREIPKAMIDPVTDEEERVREAAFRQAVNAPVQGTASDMCLVSATKLGSLLQRKEINARVINLIHDSIMIEAHEDVAERVMKLTDKVMRHEPLRWIKKEMRGIPLLVEFKRGKNWGEMQEVV